MTLNVFSTRGPFRFVNVNRNAIEGAKSPAAGGLSSTFAEDASVSGQTKEIGDPRDGVLGLLKEFPFPPLGFEASLQHDGQAISRWSVLPAEGPESAGVWGGGGRGGCVVVRRSLRHARNSSWQNTVAAAGELSKGYRTRILTHHTPDNGHEESNEKQKPAIHSDGCECHDNAEDAHEGPDGYNDCATRLRCDLSAMLNMVLVSWNGLEGSGRLRGRDWLNC